MDVQKTASSSTSDLHACKGVQLQRYLRERKSESALRWYSGCQSTINHPSSLRDDMIKAQTNKTGKINVEDIAREA